MSEVVLLYPKTGQDIGGAISPPFAVMCAASFLHRDGFKIKIIDQRTDSSWEHTLSKTLKSNPVCVGISAMTGSQIFYALQMVKKFREQAPEIPIVWGGTHPTIVPEQTLQNEFVDVVIRGEGEQTILEIVNTLEKGQQLNNIQGVSYKEDGRIINNPNRPPLDVNTLPPTPWDLINVEDYICKSLYIRKSGRMLDIGETSRGCPYACAFCCSSAIRRMWRPMTAEKTIEKICEDVQRFNLDSVWLRDDNFYIDLKRVQKICDSILQEKLDIKWYTAGTRINLFLSMTPELVQSMVKSGCDALKFGGESGCNRILKFINKGQTVEDIINSNRKAMKYNIVPCYAFMGGFPTETREELLMTVDLMIKLKRENPKAVLESLCMFTPHPATELYKVAIEQYDLQPPKRLEEWATWSYYNESYVPWLSEDQRKMLRNISDLSTYSEEMLRIVNTINSPVKRAILKSIITPLSQYFRFKWKHKMFQNTPDLKLMRYVRKLTVDKTIQV